MILTALLLATLANTLQDKPVKLAHVFARGERDQYEVKASLSDERRGYGLDTWIPSDQDFTYKFTTEVVDLQPDGIAKLRYLRPTMSITVGETATSPPVTTTEKVNANFLLSVSSINEIIEAKDETPKKRPKGVGGGELLWLGSRGSRRQGGSVLQYIGEIERLAEFVGPLDSSLDFSPKLPFDDVKVGDTWKRTVGYQPQKLQGDKEGKQAVQRLDYVYTFRGLLASGNHKVYRVTADLKVDTDIGAFYNQLLGKDAAESGIKTIPLKLTASIDFDLDPQTMKTIQAVAHSEGGFSISVTEVDTPVIEQRFKGQTVLKLIGTAHAGSSEATPSLR